MRVGIQADDLTGACDTGAPFAARGLDTVVLLPDPSGGDAPWREPPPAARDVVVLDTESRALAPEAAGARARAAMAGLAAGRPAWLYKKVDSTLRGPLAAEVRGALEATPAALALLAPAFPAQRRTVVDGRLLIDGRPAGDSPIARDPAFPPTGASVLALLGAGGPHPVGALPLATVRRGPAAVGARLCRALDTGHRALVADAETTGDLATVATAAREHPVLLAGSAGLAEVLAVAAGSPAIAPRPAIRGPLLIVAGSAHPATRLQVERLEARRREAPPATTGRRPAAVEILAPPAGERGTREAVAHRLAEAARRRLVTGPAGGRPRTLLLTGGDTAVAVCRALGATGLRLAGELEPGLAVGALLDGPGAGLAVLTKAGGFGDPDALVRVWESCA